MKRSMPAIILASSSPYRQQLLNRLGLPFNSVSPEIDEATLPGEDARQLVIRLAKNKARAVARAQPNALIIGSDQVASLGERILTKPGNHQNAHRQLMSCSGKAVVFYTGLALLNSRTGQCHTCVEPFTVHFRQLTPTEVDNYLEREQPYDCAGSFKMEGLGISLFTRMEGEDPNSLVGLPLIRLIDMLSNEGINILS